jgi:hypothetical protein
MGVAGVYIKILTEKLALDRRQVTDPYGEGG